MPWSVLDLTDTVKISLRSIA